MAAEDHLGQQFTELYHGTKAKNVDSIREEGLKPPGSAMGPANWFMLSNKKDEAGHFAGKSGAVITYHVPNNSIDTEEHGAAENHLYRPVQGAYAVRKPLPGNMIHKVDYL